MCNASLSKYAQQSVHSLTYRLTLGLSKGRRKVIVWHLDRTPCTVTQRMTLMDPWRVQAPFTRLGHRAIGKRGQRCQSVTLRRKGGGVSQRKAPWGTEEGWKGT